MRDSGDDVKLTPSEFDLLLALVLLARETPGERLAGKEISKRLWPNDPSPSNVRTHYHNLRAALGADGEKYLPKGSYYLATPVEDCGSGVSADQRQPAWTILSPAGPGVDPSNPPYVGPQPFSPDQVHEFFGRTSECEKLVKQIEEAAAKPVVILYSPSGAGKTSLLNTKVRAVLTERGYQVLPVARLGVVQGLTIGDRNPYTAAAIASIASEAEPVPGESSWETYLDRTADAGRGTILIIDQLEEIVTTVLGPPRARQEFFLELATAIQGHPSLRILLALREEFLPEILRLAKPLESYWYLFPLERLRRDSAYEAITRPAETMGVMFDPGVATALVDELARVRYVDSLGRQIDEPGDSIEPLQLQIVCQALWRCLSPKLRNISWSEINQALPSSSESEDGTMRTREGITKFVASVLQDFCGSAIEAVAGEHRFPVELIDLGCQEFLYKATRQPIHRADEYTGSLPNHIVDALASRHLLRIEDRRGGRWYELAHDTLIEAVRARSQQIDDAAVRNLWLRCIRKIAESERARLDGINEEDLIHWCCRGFVEGTGTALRIPERSLEGSVNILPLWAVKSLQSVGLVHRIVNEQESFFVASSPRMASALHQMRTEMERQRRPLNDAARIVFSTVISIIGAVVVVTMTRACLQTFHLTLTQAHGAGFVNGWFQGVIGALCWGICIAGSFSSWWYVVERGEPWQNHKQRWRATLIGAAAGLVGGILVTIALLYAQSRDSLYQAGWIVDRNQSAMTSFTQTGLGYTMIFFGGVLGLASGFSTIRILLDPEWNKLVARHSKQSSLRETRQALAAIFRHTIKHSWHIFLPTMISSALVVHGVLSVLGNPPGLLRVVGECVSLAFGGEGIVAGLLFGIFALRTGFEIPAQQE